MFEPRNNVHKLVTTLAAMLMFAAPLFRYGGCCVVFSSKLQMPCDDRGAVQVEGASDRLQLSLLLFMTFLLRTVSMLCSDIVSSARIDGNPKITNPHQPRFKIDNHSATYAYHIMSIVVLSGLLLPTLNVSYNMNGSIDNGAYATMVLVLWNAVMLDGYQSHQR